eukprot:4096879-Pleurochrysis_carterae.AAC.1
MVAATATAATAATAAAAATTTTTTTMTTTASKKRRTNASLSLAHLQRQAALRAFFAFGKHCVGLNEQTLHVKYDDRTSANEHERM